MELVAYNSQKCHPDVYHNGKTVALLGWSDKDAIERLVAQARTLSGQMVDWFYVAGRAVVKTTGDPDLIREIMRMYQTGVFIIVESDGSWS